MGDSATRPVPGRPYRGSIVSSIVIPESPPLVVVLLPLTMTIVAVMALILVILRRGWSGYRGLIGAVAFLVLAFWALPRLLAAAFTELWWSWWSFGAAASVEAILWTGVVSSVVAIFVLASLIRSKTTNVPSNRGIY